MNDKETGYFLAKCNHQRQQLVDFMAWEFRQLLAIQQNILTAVGLPCFDGPMVDTSIISIQAKICSVMHSAFCVRVKMGQDTHVKMLSKIRDKLHAEKLNPPVVPQPRSSRDSQPGRSFKQPRLGRSTVQKPPKPLYGRKPFQQNYDPRNISHQPQYHQPPIQMYRPPNTGTIYSHPPPPLHNAQQPMGAHVLPPMMLSIPPPIISQRDYPRQQQTQQVRDQQNNHFPARLSSSAANAAS